MTDTRTLPEMPFQAVRRLVRDLIADLHDLDATVVPRDLLRDGIAARTRGYFLVALPSMQRAHTVGWRAIISEALRKQLRSLEDEGAVRRYELNGTQMVRIVARPAEWFEGEEP